MKIKIPEFKKIKITEDTIRPYFMSFVGTIFIIQMTREWYTVWFAFMVIFIMIHGIMSKGMKK